MFMKMEGGMVAKYTRPINRWSNKVSLKKKKKKLVDSIRRYLASFKYIISLVNSLFLNRTFKKTRLA